MIVHSRIDNRLIHGQVVEAWVPHLRVKRLIVADDQTAQDEMAQAAMSLAVPESIEVRHTAVRDLDSRGLSGDDVPTLLLFRDVAGVMEARERGLPNGRLTVGNVHAGPGRQPVSRSVFLTPKEQEQLRALLSSGMDVVVQAVPTETPIRWSFALGA